MRSMMGLLSGWPNKRVSVFVCVCWLAPINVSLLVLLLFKPIGTDIQTHTHTPRIEEWELM